MAPDEKEEMTAGFKETDPPRDIRIEEPDRELYQDLQEDSSSPFEGSLFLDIFLMAAAVGSYEGLRQPLKGDKIGLFNVNSLSSHHKTIIRSIAWRETRDNEIYYDQKRAFEITMEFANGGIKRLHSERLGMGDTVSDTIRDFVNRWDDIEPVLEERSLLPSE